ncbi:MAG: hypothetical protein K2J16_03045 [Clostridia bacterium]|nr:hypothetical protein [Clostridia bacterium]
MKHTTIQHGLYKNLPDGTVYNSQAATLIFALGVAFKVSAAPGILSEYYGSSTLWAYMLLSFFDLISLCAVFAFVRMRGDGLLRTTGSKLYKLCCGAAAIWFIAKGTFYFCYCSSYLTHELFAGVEPSIFYLLLLAPITYMGIKGARSISRTCEIFVPLFFALILFNLVFLETDLDIGRNLPIFAVEPKNFFSELFHYGVWLGDAVPFAFLRIKNKRMPYLSVGVAITYALINIVVFLGVAIYGEALKTVSDLLIHIAIFNQLSMDIGRVEWTNLFAVVAMSILSLSFIFFGCTAASDRAIGFTLPARIIYPIVVAVVSLATRSTQIISQFSIGWIGFVMFAFALVIPLTMLGNLMYTKHKLAGIYKCLDDEYMPHPPLRPSAPDSLADNILVGMKEEAEATQTVMQNGMLQPNTDDA